MRLQDMGIEKLDSVFGQFSTLKELSLTGNSLDNVNEGMPRQLEILDLNANWYILIDFIFKLYKELI